MRIILIRHAQTAGNLLRRYIGSTDEPLSPQGMAAAAAAAPKFSPKTVYVTPLCRTRQTAEILFPAARQIVVPALREMDFGLFEGRSADEMENDAAYRAWVDGMCLGACPNGESRDAFCARVRDGFLRLFSPSAEKNTAQAVFVVHGGTIMALLSQLAQPKISYYDGAVSNCGAVSCELLRSERAECGFLLSDVQKHSTLREVTFADENTV